MDDKEYVEKVSVHFIIKILFTIKCLKSFQHKSTLKVNQNYQIK